MYIQPCKGHVLHIAVYRALYVYRMVGIALDKLLRHVAHKAHQVLLANLCIQAETHGSRIHIIEGIEVHSQFGLNVSIGRFKSQLRYYQTFVVHRYLCHQVTYLQPALLLRAQVPYYKRCVRLDVFYRVNTQVYIR